MDTKTASCGNARKLLLMLLPTCPRLISFITMSVNHRGRPESPSHSHNLRREFYHQALLEQRSLLKKCRCQALVEISSGYRMISCFPSSDRRLVHETCTTGASQIYGGNWLNRFGVKSISRSDNIDVEFCHWRELDRVCNLRRIKEFEYVEAARELLFLSYSHRHEHKRLTFACMDGALIIMRFQSEYKLVEQ